MRETQAMTKAERYEAELGAATEEERDSIVEKMYEEQETRYCDIHDDEIDVFDDGSVLSFSCDYTNEDGGGTFRDMKHWRECLSAQNEVLATNLLMNEEPLASNVLRAYPPRGWVELEGSVEEEIFGIHPDLSLRLTDITRDGELYLLGSTDYHEEPAARAPVAYTKELAGLVGQRVRVRCQPSRYREERCTSRGSTYFVDVDFLDAPTVVSVTGGSQHDIDD